MSFTVDEYDRTLCKAHDLAECPICCLSFRSINEEVAATPSDRDIGVFLPESDLQEWYAKMKKTMPRAFDPDDTLFGDDAGQHPYGTKLRTFFDEDPLHPMECFVLGSKWQMEERDFPGIPTAFADGKEPVYAVLLNGERTQIGLMDAHQGEEGEWMIDTKRGKRENDTIVNERLDMLARFNSNHQNDDNSQEYNGCSESDLYTLEAQNKKIRRALKELNTPASVDTWANWRDTFLQEFVKHCFSPFEYKTITQDLAGGSSTKESSTVSIEDRIKSFPATAYQCSNGNNNFHARLALVKMVVYHLKDHLGGVILANKRGTKYQAIEFIGFHVVQGVPCISIQYGIDPEGIKNPEDFLRGETIEVLTVENEVAVILEEHILNCTKNEGLNDLGSGLLFYTGYLAPMEIIELCTGEQLDKTSNQARIPSVNFGVELEMSCASGNRIEKMACNLAEHAGVEVRLRQNSNKGKGNGGGWPFDIGHKSPDDDDSSSNNGSDGDRSYSSHSSMPALEPTLYYQEGNRHVHESNGVDSEEGSSCSSHSSMPDLDPTAHYQQDDCVNKSNVTIETEKTEGKRAPKHTKWSICFDKSLKPNDENPLSTMLELVSPILTGESGLNQLAHTLAVMADITCVRLNQSMGLHVHIETKECDYSLKSMISICQQFIYFEEVIDNFFVQSRRSGSGQSHSYFKSNRLSVMESCNTLKGALNELASCKTRQELYDLFNPGWRARYHKLNLQNLESGRQPTIEFRQHHASKDTHEVRAWVRFCILFTTNCAKLRPLSGESLPTAEAQFDTLFADIIQCPVLREYYSTKS